MPTTQLPATPPPATPPAAPAGKEPEQIGGVLRVGLDTSAAGADAGNPLKPAAESGARPEWLPEKFASVEAMAAAYKELEAKLGAAAAPKEPATPPAPAADAPRPAGLDMAALATEYAENGGALKPDTMEKLAAAGIGADAVDAYIEGQKARASAYTASLAERVGGADQMRALFEWGRTALGADEIAAFNATMASFNEPAAALALQGLQARYVAAMGAAPSLVSAGAVGAQTAGVTPFGSNYELTQAMSDPRYRRGDAAYHRQIAARLAVTNMFGS